ncbi:MAG TPA: DUF2007 domain-containing protein [Thermoanaerobaculia bacterium]|jgi:hypothetical protein
MTASRFRLLVIAWMILYVWLSYFPRSSYKQPEYLKEAFRYNGYGAVIPPSANLGYLFLFAYLAAAVGLLIFNNWARHLLMVTNVIHIAMRPFFGVSVRGPFDSTLSFVMLLLNGTILAFAYSPPLSRAFRAARGAVVGEPEEELIEVFETSDPATVPVIGSLLESAGIEFAMTGQQMQDIIAGGGLAGHKAAIPARFLVRRSEAEFARSVLDTRE